MQYFQICCSLDFTNVFNQKFSFENKSRSHIIKLFTFVICAEFMLDTLVPPLSLRQDAHPLSGVVIRAIADLSNIALG
jgi:hypothetical protein